MAEKAVLSTNEAYDYVGGKPHFLELLAAYPKILQPYRECKPTGKTASGKPSKGKTSYLKVVIDQALKAGQMERRFVSH